jgi:hypothetical protein
MEAARPMTDVCWDRESMVRLVPYWPMRGAVLAGRSGHAVRDIAESCGVERLEDPGGDRGSESFRYETRSML